MQFGVQTPTSLGLGLQSPGLGSVSAGHLQQPTHQQTLLSSPQKNSGKLVYKILMQIHVMIFPFTLLEGQNNV